MRSFVIYVIMVTNPKRVGEAKHVTGIGDIRNAYNILFGSRTPVEQSGSDRNKTPCAHWLGG
jgi:hypothetical protein